MSMDVHGYSIMDIHGYPRISVDMHRHPWISMENVYYLCISRISLSGMSNFPKGKPGRGKIHMYAVSGM